MTTSADRPIYLVVGQLLSAGLALASAPILARALGTDGRGYVAAASSVISLAPVIAGWGGPALLRRLGALEPGSRIRIGLAFGLVQAATAVPLALVSSVYIFGEAPTDVVVVAAVGVALAPVACGWMADLSLLVVNGRYRAVMVLQVMPPLVTLFAALLLLVSSSDLPEVAISALIMGNVLCLVASRTLLIRSMRGAPRERLPTRDFLRRALLYYPGAVAEMALQRSILILALPVLGASDAGLLSVAMTAASLGLVIGQSFAASTYASAATLQPPQVAGFTARAAREVLAVSILASAVGCLAAPFVIPWIFGNDFASAVGPTIGVLVAMCVMNVGVLFVAVLNARGLGGRSSAYQLLALTTQVVISVVLAPQLGTFGFVTGLAGAYLLVCAATAFHLRLRVVDLVPRSSSLKMGLQTLLRRN